MTRKTKQILTYVIIGLVSAIIIALSVFSYIQTKGREEAEFTAFNLQAEIDANTQTVYVATRDIQKNEKLISEGESANVTKQLIYTGIEEDYYMTDEEVLSEPTAIVDIKAWTPIQSNMMSMLEIANDTREYEITVTNLMTDQKEGDYVDVRIMFPNGEDYVVLTKKLVQNLNLENCVWYAYLNEEEILRMASATIDAFTISGSYIYATRYVEENIQDEATPDYIVKQETISLMNTDPNILTIATETLNASARYSLENRLGILTSDQLDAVTAGHNIQDTAKSSVLANGDGSVYVDYGDETVEEGVTDIDTTDEEEEVN